MWVVSFNTEGLPWSGGPMGHGPAPEKITKWSLWLLDPQTGGFVGGLEVGGPPDEAAPSD